MTDKLTPVPCGCGGEAKVRASCFFTGTDLYLVQCKRCGTATLLKDTEAEAIEAWNRAMSGNVVVYGNPDSPKSKTVG